MNQQSQARIFLAETYRIHQTDEYRSIEIHKNNAPPLSIIGAVTDETLADNCSREFLNGTDSIVLPIVGTIMIDQNGNETALPCGKLMLVGKDSTMTVNNMYQDSLVNFLLMNFDSSVSFEGSSKMYAFDLDGHQNELIQVLKNEDIAVSLGKFGMRRDAAYYLANNKNACFCFVIQGSFEIEGRLLHHRDALTIWDGAHLDIESLGNESILLIVEHPLL